MEVNNTCETIGSVKHRAGGGHRHPRPLLSLKRHEGPLPEPGWPAIVHAYSAAALTASLESTGWVATLQPCAEQRGMETLRLVPRPPTPNPQLAWPAAMEYILLQGPQQRHWDAMATPLMLQMMLQMQQERAAVVVADVASRWHEGARGPVSRPLSSKQALHPDVCSDLKTQC